MDWLTPTRSRRTTAGRVVTGNLNATTGARSVGRITVDAPRADGYEPRRGRRRRQALPETRWWWRQGVPVGLMPDRPTTSGERYGVGGIPSGPWWSHPQGEARHDDGAGRRTPDRRPGAPGHRHAGLGRRPLHPGRHRPRRIGAQRGGCGLGQQFGLRGEPHRQHGARWYSRAL